MSAGVRATGPRAAIVSALMAEPDLTVSEVIAATGLTRAQVRWHLYRGTSTGAFRATPVPNAKGGLGYAYRVVGDRRPVDLVAPVPRTPSGGRTARRVTDALVRMEARALRAEGRVAWLEARLAEYSSRARPC